MQREWQNVVCLNVALVFANDAEVSIPLEYRDSPFIHRHGQTNLHVFWINATFPVVMIFSPAAIHAMIR
jgi:hypothetical protein